MITPDHTASLPKGAYSAKSRKAHTANYREYKKHQQEQ